MLSETIEGYAYVIERMQKRQEDFIIQISKIKDRLDKLENNDD